MYVFKITRGVMKTYRYLDVNWCSSEIQILRDQISDIWYYYDFDE